jgi:ATP-dependent RNA helicase RhlE
MPFKSLELNDAIIASLHQKGYSIPTPIQKQAIPAVLSGKDVFGCAQTGTGKTAAFALPLLQLIHGHQNQNGRQGKQISALILAPTRELALQISENVAVYGKRLGISHTTVFGGVNQHRQVEALRRGVDILIATPGRLLDLMEQGYVHLSSIRHFVLDEADRMLDMGFIRDIRKVIAKLPTKRQTLFFSATAAPDIMKLANDLLKNPVHIAVNPVSSTTELVKQRLYYVDKEDKRSLLSHVLNDPSVEHALVFTRTKHGADKVVKNLKKTGVTAEAIHGNKSQPARERALKGFKDRSIRVLVATDIASRGIDVDRLSHVINYEIPEVAETYVHRIGRTGRAGSSGIALSFCARDERPYMNDITKLIKKNIEVVTAHPFA